MKVIQRLDNSFKNFYVVDKLTDNVILRKEEGYRNFLLIEGEKCT